MSISLWLPTAKETVIVIIVAARRQTRKARTVAANDRIIPQASFRIFDNATDAGSLI
jgi:hypothetical protein